MDKKRRRSIIYRIGDLCEEHCKECTKVPKIHPNSGSTNTAWCGKHCDIGKELLQLGKLLEGDEKVAVKEKKKRIQTEEIVQARESGKTLSEIANQFDVTEQTVYYHLNKKNTEPKQVPVKKLEPLNDQLTRSWEEEYKTLQAKYERLSLDKRELANQFNTTCEDLENEIESLKEKLREEKNNYIVELTVSKDNLLKLNNVLRGKEATLEELTARYEREVERLNGINLEQEEKLRAAIKLLKVYL